MANAAQTAAGRVGGAAAARATWSQALALTMTAGATVSGQIAVPEGSWLLAVRFETAAAFSGAPRPGSRLVADIEVKTQGHVSATIVAAASTPGPGRRARFAQPTAVGWTNSAGTVKAIVTYAPQIR